LFLTEVITISGLRPPYWMASQTGNGNNFGIEQGISTFQLL